MTLIKFRSNSRRIRSAAIKDQRLWSENVRKVGPLTQWIILFGIFPHKLCSVSGRRPNPHLVSLCFQPWRRRYQTDVGPISKAPIYLHASGQRASIAVFFLFFYWWLLFLFFVFCCQTSSLPVQMEKLGTEQTWNSHSQFSLILHTADHSRHILDLVKFDFTWSLRPSAPPSPSPPPPRLSQRWRANWLIGFLPANGPGTPLVMKSPGVYYWQFETITFLTARKRAKSDCAGASSILLPHQLVGSILFPTSYKKKGERF